MWPDVAVCLPSLAPNLAPSQLVSAANVRSPDSSATNNPSCHRHARTPSCVAARWSGLLTGGPPDGRDCLRAQKSGALERWLGRGCSGPLDDLLSLPRASLRVVGAASGQLAAAQADQGLSLPGSSASAVRRSALLAGSHDRGSGNLAGPSRRRPNEAAEGSRSAVTGRTKSRRSRWQGRLPVA
jgi:hypothetical protein